jgi:RNA-directed DNA polymerase
VSSMDYEYYVKKRTKRSIRSLGVLKKTLSLTDDEINFFYKLLDNGKAYKKVEGTLKSTGDERLVYNPHNLVRKIQRMINSRIFNPIKPKAGLIIWPSYLYGSIPNTTTIHNGKSEIESRDYISCAQNHCLAKSILKVDITDFYENIHRESVYEIFFKVLDYSNDVSNMLTDFCCFEDKIPQGALTSSFIASAILHDVEPKVVQRLKKKKLTYTRLVDDITVSSKSRNYNFDLATTLIKEMLTSKDLPINENKLFISYHSSSATLVHGLRVNFKEPRLPESEVSRIRASVRGLESLATDSKYRVSRDYRKSYSTCLGRVNRMQRIGHNQAKGLLTRINKIMPLPSHADIVTSNKLVFRLENIYDKNKSKYSYKRLFSIAHMELNVMQRSFNVQAKQLRERLKEITPVEIE